MEAITCGLNTPCSKYKPSIITSHTVRYSISSTFKGMELMHLSSNFPCWVRQHHLKEWQPLKLITSLPKAIKTAATSLLNVFVNSMFKLEEQPMMLQGNFAPVNEIGDAIVISSIEGEIPEDFPEGVYIRNGPNFLFPHETVAVSMLGRSSYLWFEGHGMLHATYFNKNEIGNWVISYKNKYVESEQFMIEKEGNKALFLPAVEGNSPAVVAANILNLLRFGKLNLELNNTSVLQHAGKVYSVAENHMPYEIDVSNLQTGKIWELKDAWDRPFTSHPKKDPKTGEMVIMGVNAMKPYYVVGIVSVDGKKLVHKADIKLQKHALSHEIGVTENYNVIFDYPLRVDLGRLLSGGTLIKYYKDQKARIGIMHRYGNAESVTWFKVKNHCTFHIINSFEEGDEVVAIGCRASGSIVPGPDYGIDKQGWFRRAFKPPTNVTEGFDPSVDGIIFPRAYEWRLNMKTGTVQEAYLTGMDFAMDFPVINDVFTGIKNKYCYTQVLDSEQSSDTGLSKYKMIAKLHFEEREEPLNKERGNRIMVEYHVMEDHLFCSGLHFVKQPGGINEDDGWLLCYVHDEKKNISQACDLNSFMKGSRKEKNGKVHVIDAKNFTEKPVAKITLPQRVPYGFQANYISKQNPPEINSS